MFAESITDATLKSILVASSLSFVTGLVFVGRWMWVSVGIILEMVAFSMADWIVCIRCVKAASISSVVSKGGVWSLAFSRRCT